MGTGSSVHNKLSGERKTFHVTVKDATNARARPQSGLSYCAEVHVRDEASQCIDVMFICDEWASSKGGLSTFNREFAVNLAKSASDRIKVHCYVCSSSEEDRLDAKKQGVNLITARRPPGSNDPMEWLKIPPSELPTPDVVVGHGRKFGSPAYFISERTKCKWIHFVHVSCEDLGKHKLERSSTPDAIAKHEKKNKQELELCIAAGLAVAVGSRFIPVSPHDEFAPTEFAPTSTELDRVRPQPGRVRPQSSRVRPQPSRVRPQPSRVRPQQDRVRPQTFIAYS